MQPTFSSDDLLMQACLVLCANNSDWLVMGELLHDLQDQAPLHLCLAVEFGLYHDLVIVLILIPTI